MVPTSKSDLKKRKCLLLKDIQIISEHLIVSFRWSKTIQFGEKEYYRLEYNLVDIKEDDPLFTLPNKKCTFYKDFQSKLRLLMKAIGLNPEGYSSHGFSRGGSTFAFKSLVPADLIQ